MDNYSNDICIVVHGPSDFVNFQKAAWRDYSALRGCGNYINDVDFIQCEATKFPYYKDHPVCSNLESFLNENGYYHEFHLPFEGPPHQYMEGELVCINKKILK